MRKFEGKVNGKTFTDHDEFLAEALKAFLTGNCDISLTQTDRSDDLTRVLDWDSKTHESKCTSGSEDSVDITDYMIPDIFKIGREYKEAADKDEFISTLESALDDRFHDWDQKTEDVSIDKLNIAFEELKKQIDINESKIDEIEKQYDDLDSKRNKIFEELKNVNDKCEELTDEMDYEVGVADVLDIVEDYLMKLKSSKI